MAFVILGSTFFRTLKGALQNMEVLQMWVDYPSFSFVLAADFVIDIFFFISALLSTFFILKYMKEHEGNFGSYLVYVLHIYTRYTPVYAFNLFFFWKILSLFGDGPIFFLYNQVSSCESRWFWHLLYVNNLIPWSADDNCMGWTWFIANNFQFLLTVPLIAQLYLKKRNVFFYALGGIFTICTIIQLIVIIADDLSSSYFNYQNLYWTNYYVKPYARYPVFLIGLLAGCIHFS